MLLGTLQNNLIDILSNASIEDAKLETNLIIGFVTKQPHLQLNKQQELSRHTVKQITKLARKRSKHIPLQYLFKSVEFYNTTLKVNKNVLIPRPETEFLCEMVAKNIKATTNYANVLDLCCGSGAIGIALLKNCECQVTLSDVSKKALKVAKKNTALNNVRAELVRSNLFENVHQKYNVIVSNPPYIKESDLNNLEFQVKKYEPLLALNGYEDGLYFYKQIATNAPNYLHNGGKLWLECGMGQAQEIKKLFNINFKNIKLIKDINGIERYIYAEIKSNR